MCALGLIHLHNLFSLIADEFEMYILINEHKYQVFIGLFKPSGYISKTGRKFRVVSVPGKSEAL